jgi:hypothetical protein
VAFLLVATDQGVYPFTDGVPLPLELEGRSVRGLVRRRDEWTAIADGHTVVRRDSDGAWSEPGRAEATLTAVLPAPDGAWCGTIDGRLLRLHDGAFAPVDGFAGMPGRESWHAVGSRVPYVRSLSETADHRALLASVHVGGIPRSGNGGATWKPTIDVDADVHEVRAAPTDPRLVLAPAAVGLGVSHDRGSTFEIVTDGLHATYLRAVAYTADAALVSACDGPFGSHGALYRWSTVDDGPLVRLEGGLPEWLAGNVDTGKLDADRSVAAFADEEAVYVSDDAAATWQRFDPADDLLVDSKVAHDDGGAGRITAIGITET